MLAVSNTSPISNPASIGRLNLLKLQFGTLWIPDAVAGELAAHPDAVALAAIQKAIRDQWIKTAAPHPSNLLAFCWLRFIRVRQKPSYWPVIWRLTS